MIGAPPARAPSRRRAIWMTTTLLLSQAACTSFSFPGREGQGAAPSELRDRERMVQVPGGRFLMGNAQAKPDEYPPHDVEIAPFRLDRNEVTNAAYRSCVDAGVCQASTYADDKDLGGPRHPVVGVNWLNAVKYCQWVGKRLPTEAEWELAARTPELSIFPWQGRFQPTLANLRGDVDGYAKTAPVGSFPEGASGLGLLDMAGNAAEWTADWYDTLYYQTSPERAPKGPSVSTGSRVVRGGSWADTDYEARTTRRDSLDPNFGKDSVGFRCAASGD